MTAPGTPRWVGYLTGVAVLVIGLSAVFAYPDVVVGLVIGSGISIWLEVWRGVPYRSRDRIDYPPPEDEGQPS